ncbi:MAG: formimidoylglutamate deiminase [Bacteroidia bacterium]|nr:formimidoylglutamate deiminase [Bacteroidia bacterium]
MKVYEFSGLLTEAGWFTPGVVELDDLGNIHHIGTTPSEPGNIPEKIEGFAVPGFQNAHSHAFQYAMAGIAERHTREDDFWSWRENMYQLALSMNPEQMEAVATMLYAEMLRQGYTSVAEFHYVHHDPEGLPYQNLAELGERLVSAAQTAGIRITLIPIFYQQGGFGLPPTPGQRRFISASTDDYLGLLEVSEKLLKHYEKASLGVGVHSLRAVKFEDILHTINTTDSTLPFHLHVAEQLKEVTDCLTYCGKRPVEWLLENVSLSERFHLVHATHLVENEIRGLAQSGAQVVLCPSTEGNLGDGRFPLAAFQQWGGKWSIGTDSHIGISPLEELRMLDYRQRIFHHRRNIFHSENQNDSGEYGYNQALLNGRKAMGITDRNYFRLGRPFDAVIVDKSQPLIENSRPENLLSTLIYAGDSTFLRGTMVAGEWKIYEGKHKSFTAIAARFGKTIRELKNR